MTTKSMVETAWADMRQFLYHLDPDTRKIIRSLKKIKLKINSVLSSLTKLAQIMVWFLCFRVYQPL